jgi:hypothetical protein
MILMDFDGRTMIFLSCVGVLWCPVVISIKHWPQGLGWLLPGRQRCHAQPLVPRSFGEYHGNIILEWDKIRYSHCNGIISNL